MPSRLQIALPDIVALFDSLPTRAFRLTDLYAVLRDNREKWRLAKSTLAQDFIEYLLAKTRLTEHSIAFPSLGHAIYTWGKDASVYEIVLAISPNAYLSHFTAAYLHELTENVPKTIYVTEPQPSKRKPGIVLSQEQIDSSFRKPARVSTNTATFGGYRVTLLTGMQTKGNLGITTTTVQDVEGLAVTTIERTLIDMVVRPMYAGGVHNVLAAFEMAAGRMSTNKLLAMLRKLDYVYPYHQAIGFYMERSGAYPDASLDLVRELEQTRDFYLTHDMGQAEYHQGWRLFVPKGML